MKIKACLAITKIVCVPLFFFFKATVVADGWLYSKIASLGISLNKSSLAGCNNTLY